MSSIGNERSITVRKRSVSELIGAGGGGGCDQNLGQWTHEKEGFFKRCVIHLLGRNVIST